MHRLFAFVQRCAFVTFLLAVASHAQITDISNSTSVPIPGAGHNYIQLLSETVDPANGSLSLRLAVPVPHGRGLTIPFSVGYDSQGVFTVLPYASGPSLKGSSNDYLTNGGWSYTIPRLSIQQTTRQIQKQNVTFYCPIHSGFVFQNGSGDRHALGLVTEQVVDQCPTNGQHLSVQGLAYEASATGFNPSMADQVQVSDPDGTTYSWQGTVSQANPGSCLLDGTVGDCNTSYLTTLIEDRNGNQVAIHDLNNGAFTVTDTLDRSVLASSGFGHTGNTITVSGLDGNYSITWTSAPFNFSSYWNRLQTGYCLVSGTYTFQGSNNVISAIRVSVRL
jgi:hypothetical protein